MSCSNLMIYKELRHLSLSVCTYLLPCPMLTSLHPSSFSPLPCTDWSRSLCLTMLLIVVSVNDRLLDWILSVVYIGTLVPTSHTYSSLSSLCILLSLYPLCFFLPSVSAPPLILWSHLHQQTSFFCLQQLQMLCRSVKLTEAQVHVCADLCRLVQLLKLPEVHKIC